MEYVEELETIKGILTKIERLRKEQHLSIYQLTEMAELSENTIYNWYNKGATPSIPALINVCKVLGTTLPDLFCLNEVDEISYQEKSFLRRLRSLNERKRRIILDLLSELTPENEKES